MEQWLQEMTARLTPWAVVGIVGQLCFGFRWIIQWYASEKHKKSVVPAVFWYISFLGAVLTILSGVKDRNPALLVGGVLPLVIYTRNIMFLRRAASQEPPA